MRRLLWPFAVVLTMAAVVISLALFKVDLVTLILVPVVVAALIPLVVQRLPQMRRPVRINAQVNDVDYVVLEDGTHVPASGHTVRITVETAGPSTVLLDRLRAVVTHRDHPRGDLHPHLGVVEPRPFEVLLDKDPPLLRPISTAGKTSVDFPFSVAANDPEVFDLTVVTDEADVRWHLELDTICLGRRRTTRIDLRGQPFRTIARPQHVRKERHRVAGT